MSKKKGFLIAGGIIVYLAFACGVILGSFVLSKKIMESSFANREWSSSNMESSTHDEDNLPPINAEINPSEVSVDSEGNVYIAGLPTYMATGPSMIKEYNRDNKMVNCIYESKGYGKQDFHSIDNMAFDSKNNLYVVKENIVEIFNQSGIKTEKSWKIPGASSTSVNDMVIKNDLIYIAVDEKILVFNSDGEKLDTIKSKDYNNVFKLDTDGQGNFYVVGTKKTVSQPVLEKWDKYGNVIFTLPQLEPNCFPLFVALNKEGNVYMAWRSLTDIGKDSTFLAVYTPEGKFLRKISLKNAEGNFIQADQIYIDNEDHLWILDRIIHQKVYCFDANGKWLRTIGNKP